MTLVSVLWGTGRGWGRTAVGTLPGSSGRPGQPATERRRPALGGLARQVADAVGSCAVTYRFVRRLERDGVRRFPSRDALIRQAYAEAPREGLVLEFGVYRGQSINGLAEMAPERTIYGFDSFEGLPENWVAELPQGAFSTAGRLPPVRSNVRLLKGWFQQTLGPFLEAHPEPAALVHLDADLMSSTRYVLDTLGRAGRLVDGCVIQFDDFYGWSNRYRNGDFAAWEGSEASRRPYRFLGYVLPPSGQAALRLGSA